MRGKIDARAALAAAVGLLFIASLAPGHARANMANPSDPGDVVGEPSGALRDLAVVREALEIDLRPLASGEPAMVAATYEIRNDGTARTVDLVFVATSLTGTGTGQGQEPAVTLDGTAVPFGVTDQPDTTWPPPSTTPLFDGRPLRYEAQNRGQLLFSLTFSPGPHTVAVRYRADASRLSGDSPTVYWQLGYVLAPARQWASFGTLDVAVHVPAGWRAASTPALSRTGDELTGHFEGVPADNLALTVQMPPPAAGVPWALVGLAGMLLGAVLVGWLAGRALGRRGRSSLWALPLSILYGVAAFVGTLIVAIVGETSRSAGVPAAQVAWTYGYGSGLLFVLLSPVVAVVAGVACQVAAWLAGARARGGRPPVGGPATAA